jgi:vacuolar-type H+-ATPase subunit E/Vma4
MDILKSIGKYLTSKTPNEEMERRMIPIIKKRLEDATVEEKNKVEYIKILILAGKPANSGSIDAFNSGTLDVLNQVFNQMYPQNLDKEFMKWSNLYFTIMKTETDNTIEYIRKEHAKTFEPVLTKFKNDLEEITNEIYEKRIKKQEAMLKELREKQEMEGKREKYAGISVSLQSIDQGLQAKYVAILNEGIDLLKEMKKGYNLQKNNAFRVNQKILEYNKVYESLRGEVRARVPSQIISKLKDAAQEIKRKSYDEFKRYDYYVNYYTLDEVCKKVFGTECQTKIEELEVELAYEVNNRNLAGNVHAQPISLEGGGKKWSMKYKKSINCRRPKGFSQRQHCKRKEFNKSKYGRGIHRTRKQRR